MPPAIIERRPPQPVPCRRPGLRGRIRRVCLLTGLLGRQFSIVYRAHVQVHDGACCHGVARPRSLKRLLRAPLRKVRAAVGIVRRMAEYDRRLVDVCRAVVGRLAADGCGEIALYGGGDAARVLGVVSKEACVPIRGLCPFGPEPVARPRPGLLRFLGSRNRRNHGFRSDPPAPAHPAPQRHLGHEVWSEDQLAGWPGPVVVAAFVNTERRVARLRELGIPDERIIVLPAIDAVDI